MLETAITCVDCPYRAREQWSGTSLRQRWIIPGPFGLVCGFGFADISAD